MPIELRALVPADLEPARRLLGAACAGYRAGEVAAEKLYGPAPGPAGRPTGGEAWAALDGRDLVGAAVASGRFIRLIAVHPAARGRGIGTLLLCAAESAIAATGAAAARTLDQPGNYLAPGVNADDRETLAWLGRRGYTAVGTNTNLEIDVAGNPRIAVARGAALDRRAADAGYRLRRASAADRADLAAAVAGGFSPAWAFEVDRALDHDPPGVHVAIDPGGALAAFAVHDGNNRGLGWFGPAGTFPAHRRRGLGEALLMRCLLDVAAAGHPRCTVAWIGPRDFYQRSAGIAGERRFVVLEKPLSPAAARGEEAAP